MNLGRCFPPAGVFFMLQHISKTEINALPLGSWPGPVERIETGSDARKAVALCARERILGFDTETRAAFRKGEVYAPALLQLATADRVFLFRVQKQGVLQACRPVFEEASVIKTGVAIADDLKALRAIDEFTPSGFVELQTLSTKMGLRNNGLRGLAALLLGFRVSKGAQTTNWELPQLSERQLRYAATDAWVSREIYLALTSVLECGDNERKRGGAALKS